VEDERSEFFLTIPPAPPRADPNKNPEKDSLEGDKKEANFTAVLAADADDSEDEVTVGCGVLGDATPPPPFFIIIILVDREDGADATVSNSGDFFLVYCHRFRDHIFFEDDDDDDDDDRGVDDGDMVLDNKLISSSRSLP
jgi:hypothetical protein